MDAVLLFEAAGIRLGVSLGDMLRLLPDGPLVPVPFAHPALAGLLVQSGGHDDVVPVFELDRLAEPTSGQLLDPRVRPTLASPSPTSPAAAAAAIAVIPTARGPVGLRLERLASTAAGYAPVEPDATDAQEVPAALAPCIAGQARAADDKTFGLFSAEAFVAALGLAGGD
jgi:hypothetical protein